MQHFFPTKVKGYIEGYYGKLFNWEMRIQILKCLAKNKMNFYFYCPKEDIHHRFLWKKKYKKKWLNELSIFCNFAKKVKIEIIAGISPGLDFNFQSLINGDNYEFSVLVKKYQQFISAGVNYLAIMFDDLPDETKTKYKNISEGKVHAELANLLNLKFKKPIIIVPRIYSDELILDNCSYIEDLYKNLNFKPKLFYCGKYIVSKCFNTNSKIINEAISKDEIIFWDNFYANDYCPKRLILGPYKNKKLLENTMINGTGLVQTDMLILQIVNKTSKKKNKLKIWKKILHISGVPKNFYKVKDFFLSPNFTNETKQKPIKTNKNIYKHLDVLLWKWKSNLSLEWYSYLLNLKHDLQIANEELSSERILKTQTKPMQIKLINKEKVNYD